MRTQRFVRYLPQFGWNPFVISKPVPNNDSGNDAANTFYAPSIRLNKPFRIESFTWIPFMFAKALKILRRYRSNVLLISCPPFHPALAEILLKKMLGIKLVVDYRDAWSLNPYYHHLDWFHNLVLRGDRIMEERLLRNVDLLIVSHRAMKEKYLNKYHSLQDRIEVVYNGFDPESIESHHSPLFPEFTILHLGDFYAKQKTRDPTLFLSALREMISEQQILPGQLRVLFIGERYPEIEKAIVGKGLSAFVSYIDRVPHDIAMEYLMKSHMVLLIEKRDVMTTKVFEYLATGKPILCLVKGRTELEQFVRKFSSNSYIISTDSVDETKESISKCYDEYQLGKCTPVPNEEFKKNFNRMEQTRRLAESLTRVVHH